MGLEYTPAVTIEHPSTIHDIASDSEDVADIVKSSVAQINKERPEAKIKYIDCQELDTYLKDLESKEPKERHRLIIHNTSHYTTVDISPSNTATGKPTAIVLDAANDLRVMMTLNDLSNNRYDCYIPSGFSFKSDTNLQKDHYSCPLFALDHALQMSYMSDQTRQDIVSLATTTADFNSWHGLNWDDFPPEIVCNAQSISTLEQYQAQLTEKNPTLLTKTMPNGKTLAQYLKEGTKTYHDETNNNKLVTRNESINVHVLQNVVRLLNSANEQTLSPEDNIKTTLEFKEVVCELKATEAGKEAPTQNNNNTP